MDLYFLYVFYILKNTIPFYTYVLLVKEFKIISSFLLKLLGENKSVKSVSFLPANIKSINPVQKYPQIIESYACILKIFVIMFSLGICFLRNYLPIKQSNEFQYHNAHQDLLYMLHLLF